MKIHALWLGASMLALATGVAAAQTAPAAKTDDTKAGTVQEVVVTAERRTTNLQSTAIAATVLTQQDLVRNGVFTVDQLQFVSPSLTVNNFGQGNDVDIRGIGKGEHNTQTGTGVVTYRDGVATFPGYIQEEPYYDIASVEVLRGPQGTFSGQNATGGAVIVNTQDPKIHGGYTGYLLGHYGNYNDYGVQGGINIPIDDTLAARASFYTQHRSSFYHISGPWKGDPDLNWVAGRFSLLWQPTPAIKVTWKTDADYLYNGGYFGDPLTSPSKATLFRFSNNYNTYAGDNFIRSIVKADYVDPSSGITFRSVSSYQQGRTEWVGDIDGTASGPGQLNFGIDEAVNERLYSEEINVISPENKPISWIIGGYYQSNKYDFPKGRFDIAVPPGGVDEELEGVNKTHSSAVFGQLSFNLPHGFQIQAGARYSDWSTTNHVRYYVPEFIAFGFDFHQNQNYKGSNVTGKLTLNWQYDANNFLYAFVASGAKPGGLNTTLYFGALAGVTPAPFKQEYVTDYEVGWKTRLFDRHVKVQLGAFYNIFKNFQVIIPIPNQPTEATEQNVPRTKLYGVEASAQAVFGDLSFQGGMGLQKSELGTFYSEDPRLPTAGTCSLATGPATATCRNLSGNSQTYAPDFTFNAGVQYNFRLAGGDVVTPSLNFSHISSQWASLFENRAAGDYLSSRNILNGTLSWTHGTWVASLYAYNATNQRYVAAALPPIRIAGAPRQYGVTLLKAF